MPTIKRDFGPKMLEGENFAVGITKNNRVSVSIEAERIGGIGGDFTTRDTYEMSREDAEWLVEALKSVIGILPKRS